MFPLTLGHLIPLYVPGGPPHACHRDVSKLRLVRWTWQVPIQPLHPFFLSRLRGSLYMSLRPRGDVNNLLSSPMTLVVLCSMSCLSRPFRHEHSHGSCLLFPSKFRCITLNLTCDPDLLFFSYSLASCMLYKFCNCTVIRFASFYGSPLLIIVRA